jgi:hypothetical protein
VLEQFEWFVKSFIEKSRQERWLVLANGFTNQRAHKFNQFERHLNERCTLIELNIFAPVKILVNKLRLKNGYLIDLRHLEDSRDIIVNNFESDFEAAVSEYTIVTFAKEQIAFAFLHCGVWICRKKMSLLGMSGPPLRHTGVGRYPCLCSSLRLPTEVGVTSRLRFWKSMGFHPKPRQRGPYARPSLDSPRARGCAPLDLLVGYHSVRRSKP